MKVAKASSNITPEQARQILAENGMHVTLDKAKEILRLLLLFAQAVVSR